MHDFLMIDAVVEAVLSLDPEGSHIVVKPHPTGDTRLLRDFCARRAEAYGNLSYLPVDIDAILDIAHVCVTLPPSTVGLEAMLARRPVIVFDRYFKRGVVPYVRMGAALSAEDGTSMEEALRTLYYDREARDDLDLKAREYLQYAVHKPDGRGARRIALLVDELMEGRKPPRFL
jgi:hypothetical protein